MSTQGWNEILHVSIVDGAAVTALGPTSIIPTASVITLPPGFWVIGKAVRIKATGRISSLITTPGTARFDIRLGGTVVFDGLAVLLDTVAAHTNVGWSLEIILTCRAQGNSTVANLMGQGTWICEDILGVPATAPKGVLTAILPWNSAPAPGAGFNSTIAQTLDLQFTQTASTGSITVHQYVVEALN